MAPRRTKKLFVLDTNVLLHDPNALFQFDEHDVYIPFVTLEELDGKKVGMQDINRNARQATRLLDDLAGSDGALDKGYPLKSPTSAATGRLYLQHELIAPPVGAELKNDNRYLTVLEHLARARSDRKVVLVSKDINLRVKARAMGMPAEDYRNDQVLSDRDVLPAGWRYVPESLLSDLTLLSTEKGKSTYLTPQLAPALRSGDLLVTADTEAVYRVLDANANSAEVMPYPTSSAWGIKPRNLEQRMALAMMMDPDIDFITLLGPAGTGKTLLTLAAALETTFEKKLFSEILFTRATVPLGEDIGFLPGTEEEKMAAWMGAMEDNLDVLLGKETAAGAAGGKASDFSHGLSRDLIRSRLRVKSMSFMRGRSFHGKFVIIDEAQNMTPRQMKALVTRAGEGTKIICMGNLAQIDSPYLTEASSGLAYVVDRFGGWRHHGHLILEKGERSRLANYANDVL